MEIQYSENISELNNSNYSVSNNVDMDIDDLSNKFSYNTSVIWKPRQHFINDINVIIDEISNYENIINLDIYEMLVSCGNKLTWDQDYYISREDLYWFKNEEGKKFFLTNLNEKKSINTIMEYKSVADIYFKLTELFELQLED